MTTTRQKARLFKSALADRAHEWEPSYTMDKHIAQARSEMGEQRWAELNKEWEE